MPLFTHNDEGRVQHFHYVIVVSLQGQRNLRTTRFGVLLNLYFTESLIIIIIIIIIIKPVCEMHAIKGVVKR